MFDQIARWLRRHSRLVFTFIFVAAVIVGATISATPDCAAFLGQLEPPTTESYVIRDGLCVPIELPHLGIERFSTPESQVEAHQVNGILGVCAPSPIWGGWFLVASILIALSAYGAGQALLAAGVPVRKQVTFAIGFAAIVLLLAVALLFFVPHVQYPQGLVSADFLRGVRASFLELSVPTIVSLLPLFLRTRQLNNSGMGVPPQSIANARDR